MERNLDSIIIGYNNLVIIESKFSSGNEYNYDTIDLFLNEGDYKKFMILFNSPEVKYALEIGTSQKSKLITEKYKKVWEKLSELKKALDSRKQDDFNLFKNLRGYRKKP